MNDKLHHKWNSERDPQRGSSDEVKEDPSNKHEYNKVVLRQNKPR